jgi:hypothetical protein
MTGYSLTKVYQKFIEIGIPLWRIMIRGNADIFMMHPIRPRLREARPDSPVGGEFLLCLLRVIGVVEDKLPEVVVTVQVEPREFNCQAAWLGTDYFPIGLDEQFAFE